MPVLRPPRATKVSHESDMSLFIVSLFNRKKKNIFCIRYIHGIDTYDSCVARWQKFTPKQCYFYSQVLNKTNTDDMKHEKHVPMTNKLAKDCL